MTICTKVLTNYVPAVAARRIRQVLFILNGCFVKSDLTCVPSKPVKFRGHPKVIDTKPNTKVFEWLKKQPR